MENQACKRMCQNMAAQHHMAVQHHMAAQHHMAVQNQVNQMAATKAIQDRRRSPPGSDKEQSPPGPSPLFVGTPPITRESATGSFNVIPEQSPPGLSPPYPVTDIPDSPNPFEDPGFLFPSAMNHWVQPPHWLMHDGQATAPWMENTHWQSWATMPMFPIGDAGMHAGQSFGTPVTTHAHPGPKQKPAKGGGKDGPGKGRGNGGQGGKGS